MLYSNVNVLNATESHTCKWLQRHALCAFYHSVLKDVAICNRSSPNIPASEELCQRQLPKNSMAMKMVIILPAQNRVGFPEMRGNLWQVGREAGAGAGGALGACGLRMEMTRVCG